MPQATSVNLNAHYQTFVQEQLATGRYESADEVVRESLRLLEYREERMAALRSQLDIGQAELDRGEYVDWSSLKAELGVR